MKWRCRATASTLAAAGAPSRSIVEHDRFDENYVLLRWIDAGILGLHERADASSCWTGAAADARLVEQLTALVNACTRRRGAGSGATAPRGRRRRDGRADRGAARSRWPTLRRARSSAASASTTSPSDASEFGMLVAAPEHRGTGVGRALVDVRRAAQPRARPAGDAARAARPAHVEHPSKEFLKAWYGRLRLPAHPHRPRRRRPSAAGAAARHAVRHRRLREAAQVHSTRLFSVAASTSPEIRHVWPALVHCTAGRPSISSSRALARRRRAPGGRRSCRRSPAVALVEHGPRRCGRR